MFQVAIPDSNTLIRNGTENVTRNFTGLQGATFESNLWPQYGLDYTAKGEIVTFATVFGVLFSGVTGIMAGANMSGESVTKYNSPNMAYLSFQSILIVK